MSKIRKMKLYRMVPNALTVIQSGYAFEENFNFESLYHSLGYVSFTGEISSGWANKLSKRVEEEGKFFYMCPEHALEYLPLYPLFNDCFKMMEYDVPLEIVYDIIGVGEYGYSSSFDKQFEYPKAESYISKSLFGTIEKASTVLTDEQKIDAFIDNYIETADAFQALLELGHEPMMFTRMKYDKVKDFSRDNLKDYLLENNIVLKAFLKNDNEVVKSNFLTGKSVIVHRSFEMKDECVNKANRKLLGKGPFDFNYTYDEFKEKNKFMYEYARLIEQGKYEESKEYIKAKNNII